MSEHNQFARYGSCLVTLLAVAWIMGCAHVAPRPVSAKAAIKKAVDLFSEQMRGPIQTYHIEVYAIEIPELGETNWCVAFRTNSDVAPVDSDVFIGINKKTGRVSRVFGQ